ncbi:CAMK family protein kinase [Tritrichomonas foetus]|uniref:CAMK family protein kinase n=1 Tax=Tritrichomonas foetus TaxID=1144522 RepID=A0A1J4KC37_9EUKA|nr:CAMK family protein kinase [Tritrichomonas foetus]|eukprot:OHT07021.1 CAMK family protein kinase [Tritrichomonas foetus]
MEEEITLKNIQGKIIDDFEILEQFSHGGFSQVHFARHIPTNTYCAAKVIDLMEQSMSSFNGIMREISVFMQVEHPNISTFFRLSYHEPLLIFFMEYSSKGTLLSYVNKNKGLEEPEARRIFLQLYSVLRHLHAYHFLVHRDLKLENVLLDKNNNIKLIDFGLSTTYYNNLLRTFVGTPGYQPPEIIAGGEYGEKCDVWSLGILLHTMLTGSLPFTIQSASMKALLQEAADYTPPVGISPQLNSLLKMMLQGIPDKRPTLLQLQSHPWLHGIPPISSNFAPKPIKFYKINDTNDILRFKRSLTKFDPKIIEKCESVYKINPDELQNKLNAGEICKETTIYWILTNPLTERPHLAPPPPPVLPPLPPLNSAKRSGSSKKGQMKLSATLNLNSSGRKLASSRMSVPIPRLNHLNISKGYRNSLGLRQIQMKSSRV